MSDAQAIDYDRLADAVAERVARLLSAAAPPPASTRYADALHNPLGTRRAFADAARAGSFPTFRRCRRVTALWSDVERWIESRPTAKRRAVTTPLDADALDPAKLLAASLAARRPRSKRAA